jgi:LCP family protein required for cell wall assembly
MNKIDDAYNAGMQQQMINDRAAYPGWSSAQLNFDGNEAGRRATVQTVQALTGVTIDKFAELNLVGFYELASEFGGAEVCVKPWPGGAGFSPHANLSDPNSGVVLKPGYQLLSPEQTLAFVRARDSLPEGDLDRTARQQAVLDYVLWKLKTGGILTDVGKMSSLLTYAQQYLVTSANWNLLQFAGEMDALSSQNLVFHTLPVTGTENLPSVGDVNTVNVAQIRQQVQQAFATPPASSTGAPGGGASTDGGKGSAGSTGSGEKAATASPAKTATAEPPAATTPAAGASGSVSPAPAPSSSAPSFTTINGNSITVTPNARYGIPCVY